MLEPKEFRLQICCGPEQRAVEELAPNGADQALHERMGQRDIRNHLDLRYLKDSKVGLPLMESIERIMIRTEVFRQVVPAQGPLEHPAQRAAVDSAGADAEPDDTAGKLIHHHQHPMSSQDNGLASEQVEAPQAVLGVAEKGEPGWTSGIPVRPVMNAQNTANHIFVYLDAESQCDLLRDSGASQPGFRRFISSTASMSSLVGPFGPGRRPRLG